MKKWIYSCFAFMFMSTVADAMSVNMDEPRTIVADKIEYDVKSDTIKTVGNTEIVNQSGQRMTLMDSYITQQGHLIRFNNT